MNDTQNTNYEYKPTPVIKTIIGTVIVTIVILLILVRCTSLPKIVADSSNTKGVIDAITIILGIAGSIASITSIVISRNDYKRYNAELRQMRLLFASSSRIQSAVSLLHSQFEQLMNSVTKLSTDVRNTLKYVDFSEQDKGRASTDWKPSEDSGED